MLKRAGVLGAATGALAAGAGAAAWWQLFRRSLPATEGSITVQGPSQRVEIRRDRWGVPHIHAREEHDLWFGQGFCHGQDRLWQLDLYRRVARGRLAEIAGPDGLSSDRFLLTLGIARHAEAEVAELDSAVREALRAFSEGINAAVDAAGALPAELQILRTGFDEWTPADSLAAHKLLSFGLSTNWERELLRAEMARELGPELAARLDPTYPEDNPVVTVPGERKGSAASVLERAKDVRRVLKLAPEATGSNNWAVAPSRSATGGALVAGDPHLPPSMPGITYQVGLHAGERFARGGSLPGMPGVVFGQNNDVAWTFTNAMADVMDLFIEELEGDRYRFEGEWRDLEVTEHEIPVRGGDPDRLMIRSTHHGPLVNEALHADESMPLALSWMSASFPAITRANIEVLHVTSGADLVDLLADHHTPVSNLVWADASGSIGYKTVGRVPVRRGGSPDLPRDGASGKDEWDGWVPYGELPEVTDPEIGFLVTANNRIAADGPHISSDYLDGYRAARIEALLAASDEHDLDGFARIQTDMLSLPGLQTAHRLARLRPRNQDETRAIEHLRSWDGRMSADSIAATIYQAFTLRLAREVARSAIGDRDLAARWLDRADNGFIAHTTAPWRWQSHLLALWEEGDDELVGRSWDELVLDALGAALSGLRSSFGDDPEGWRWGEVHELRFPHALGGANPVFERIFNRSLEVGGGQETVAQVGWDPNDPFEAIWAPCWRMVADPADPDASRWQQYTGNSGHPGSRHYDDLQPRWRDGLTQPMAGEGPWEVLVLEPRLPAGG